jgi:hypothetical protein
VPDGYRVGGSFTYAIGTARNLGERAVGITSFGPDLHLDNISDPFSIYDVPSTVTTTFENRYSGAQRLQFVLAVASRLEAGHVPLDWQNSEIVHLAPVAQEVSPGIIDMFPKSFIGITPQGWLRRWRRDGRVTRSKWADDERVLHRANAVVLSEDDVIGGEATLGRYARQTPILAVTRGKEGADIYYQGAVHRSPAFPVSEVDPTGAGDVFAAAFFIKLHRSGDPLLAGRFANCAASFAVEGMGIQGIPSLDQIERRMST